MESRGREKGLPFGFSEHLGATFSWWRWNKGSDKEGAYKVSLMMEMTPLMKIYIFRTGSIMTLTKNLMIWIAWFSPNKWWHKRWFDIIRELIDLYQPDFLYTDGGLPFGDNMYEVGLNAVAHLYNTSAANHNGKNYAVYTQKDRRQEIYSVGVLDIERSQSHNIKPKPWQTDTCLGDWFYNVRSVYKKPGHVIEILVDIISKNGNLLLNIPQKPDGTIDDECTYTLKEMAKWIGVCGEGVYGTRPFG